MCFLNVSAAEINWCEQRPLIWGGWLDQLRLKLTQSPTGVGVKVGTELGNNPFPVWIDPVFEPIGKS